MSLKRELTLRNGTVSIAIYKGESDGKVLVSFDKDFVSRRVKGPLFTEKEMREVGELIRDYEECEWKAIHNVPDWTEPQTQASAAGQAEIAAAIYAACTEVQIDNGDANAERSEAKITVVPSLPDFKWAHTCPRCGCHIYSTLRISTATLRICPGCEYVHKAT